MFERFKGGTGEEPEQKTSSRPDTASELRERRLQTGCIGVDQRVPSEQPSERPDLHPPVLRPPKTIACVGVCGASSFDELGDGVDSGDLCTLIVEPVRPLSWAASNVQQRSRAAQGPGAYECEIGRGGMFDAPHGLDVLISPGPVCSLHAFAGHRPILFRCAARLDDQTVQPGCAIKPSGGSLIVILYEHASSITGRPGPFVASSTESRRTSHELPIP